MTASEHDGLVIDPAALERLASGTYGRCEECEGPISEARLEAMPAARLCITCASKRK